MIGDRGREGRSGYKLRNEDTPYEPIPLLLAFIMLFLKQVFGKKGIEMVNVPEMLPKHHLFKSA
ncbi:MAG: hypothetical protein IBX39_00485 [Candidatus Methanoperedenaceae archaeon]|nr:hypothetical protein [Candidatus Methanoperedenaceae archaeon]